ncbi:unnamed protein product, partial [Penicillium pancosmium]
FASGPGLQVLAADAAAMEKCLSADVLIWMPAGDGKTLPFLLTLPSARNEPVLSKPNYKVTATCGPTSASRPISSNWAVRFSMPSSVRCLMNKLSGDGAVDRRLRS